MCVVIRAVKTLESIIKILGHKTITSLLIGLDSVLFLLVFKKILSDTITIPIVITMVVGYIVGYLLGAIFEEKLALGKVFVTLKVSKEDSPEISKILKAGGYVFIMSKRYYSHTGKLRKLYKAVIFRKELPHLRHILRKYNIVGTVENVKSTFGKPLRTKEEYLNLQNSNDYL